VKCSAKPLFQRGFKRAFNSLRIRAVEDQLINASVGDYSLRLENGEKIELALGEITDNIINFDVSGRVPGF
jgi:hypothetical protein